jgi:hypothetical protein
MDPLTFLALCALAAGAVGAFDAASGGLVRAEIGGGVRGAGKYIHDAERARWGRARSKAREIRTATPNGRAVQDFLDRSGEFARALGSELRALGSGIAEGWRSGRVRAKAAREERMAGQPWPIVRGGVRITDWLGLGERSGSGSGAGDPNEDPNETAWWDPNGITEDPFLGGPTRDPNGNPDDDPLPPRCSDCGMPIVIGTLEEHRLGRDRCPHANPNGDPNVTDSPIYGTPATGDRDPHVFDCGCCGTIHEPLAPGAHCPNCHMHDPTPNPNQPAPAGTRGNLVADTNSAPAAIAAWEAIGSRWESLQSRTDALHAELETLGNETDALHGDVGALADGMGDFAIGGESDVTGALGGLVASMTTARESATAVTADLASAKERTDGYVDALHLEYDASIEAAAGKAASAHEIMQEV